MSIVTMISDFGPSGGYVGAMKGAVLSANPQAVLVDMSHTIGPQNVLEAAILLEQTLPFFPEGTVHLAVVDPGVGTERRAVAVKVAGQFLVGPDNGLFWPLVESLGATTAVALDKPQYWRTPVSRTFHGRDLFGPVAGHLSAGVALDAVGSPLPVADLFPLEIPRAAVQPGEVRGEVLYVDYFGNLISNIRPEDFPPDIDPFCARVLVAGMEVGPVVTTYGAVPPGALLATVGGFGRLEIAVNRGSAYAYLDDAIGPGSPVTVISGNPDVGY